MCKVWGDGVYAKVGEQYCQLVSGVDCELAVDVIWSNGETSKSVNVADLTYAGKSDWIASLAQACCKSWTCI